MSSSKVALVTGSGKRRVGWHVAEALAERGYALAVHYRSSASEAAETVDVERGWSAPEPGTYFPVVRVVAQRDRDGDIPYARLRNLARVRVVVS